MSECSPALCLDRQITGWLHLIIWPVGVQALAWEQQGCELGLGTPHLLAASLTPTPFPGPGEGDGQAWASGHGCA